jgi:hypothetical protein
MAFKTVLGQSPPSDPFCHVHFFRKPRKLVAPKRSSKKKKRNKHGDDRRKQNVPKKKYLCHFMRKKAAQNSDKEFKKFNKINYKIFLLKRFAC